MVEMSGAVVRCASDNKLRLDINAANSVETDCKENASEAGNSVRLVCSWWCPCLIVACW